jgi:hypothetical protein
MSATTTSFDHARPLLPPDRWRPQSPTTAVPTRPSPPWFPPPPLSRRPTRAPPPLSSAQARREGQHDFHASTVIAPHLYPSSLCSRVTAPLCTALPIKSSTASVSCPLFCTAGRRFEAYTWKTCTRVRWALIVSLTALWTVAIRGALLARVCHVVRLIPLQGLNWLESPRYPWIWVTLARCSHSVVILLS